MKSTKNAQLGMKDESKKESDDIQSSYGSMSSCHGATGIPLALMKAAKNGGCKAFHDSSRVRLAPLLRWIFEKGDKAENMDWGKEFSKWKAKREKIRHDKDDRKILDKSEADEAANEITGVMFAELDRVFKQELPAALRGCDERQIYLKCDQAIERLKILLGEKFAEIATDEPKEGKGNE